MKKVSMEESGSVLTMQKARIDEHGNLVLSRGGLEVIAHCNVGGVSSIKKNWKIGVNTRLLCAHDCPGWKEEDATSEIVQDYEGNNALVVYPRSVTLCFAMNATYEITQDDRKVE